MATTKDKINTKKRAVRRNHIGKKTSQLSQWPFPLLNVLGIAVIFITIFIFCILLAKDSSNKDNQGAIAPSSSVQDVPAANNAPQGATQTAPEQKSSPQPTATNQNSSAQQSLENKQHQIKMYQIMCVDPMTSANTTFLSEQNAAQKQEDSVWAIPFANTDEYRLSYNHAVWWVNFAIQQSWQKYTSTISTLNSASNCGISTPPYQKFSYLDMINKDWQHVPYIEGSGEFDWD